MMDQEIVKEEGMSIPDIFATYGEEYFRNCETELLKKMQSRKMYLFPAEAELYFENAM